MIARIVAIMIAASLSACGHDTPSAPTTPPVADTPPSTPTPPPSAARVQGVVLDFQTARPVAGAVVAYATDSSANGVAETSVSDANGRYSLTQPPPRANREPYYFIVDNQFVGRGYPQATNYRADVALDKGRCVARFGMVLDSRTYLPIVGATARNLSNQVRATTGQDGWYHIDWGCGVGQLGFNTTWHIMSHPDYNPSNFASGRGIGGAYREDVLLAPK